MRTKLLFLVFVPLCLPNQAQGQVQWAGVEKDKLQSDGTILVEMGREESVGGWQKIMGRLPGAINKFPNGAGTTEFFGLSPYSGSDTMTIGKNDSTLIECYPSHPVVVTSRFPDDLTRKIQTAGVADAKRAITDSLQTWNIPPLLKARLQAQIESATGKEELTRLLTQGVQLSVKRWAEYKIGGAIPDAKVSFGRRLGEHHAISWSIVAFDEKGAVSKTVESSNGPLTGQIKHNGVTVQLWGGKWPCSTKMRLDDRGEFSWEIVATN
jgi:hypothetical protein